MEKMTICGWVDTGLISRLDELRRLQLHLPPLRMMAVRVVEEGLIALEEGDLDFTERATPGGERRPFTVSLPKHLFREVVRVSRESSEASTRSAALHLILWAGANRLMQQQEECAKEASG